MAAFPILRILLVGLLGHQLLEVEADAVADAASSQVMFLRLNSLILRPKWNLKKLLDCGTLFR